MKYQYLLMLIIGVILVIAGLWLSVKMPPVVEGLTDTSTVVMVGLSASNTYYADQGLTNAPNWKAVTGGLTQVSGSLGQMVGVYGTSSIWYGTQFNVPGSPFNWVQVPGQLLCVSFDYPLVAGIATNGVITYIDNITTNPTTAAWQAPTGAMVSKTFKWIAISIGRGYAIGTDNLLYYASNVRAPAWINVSGSIAGKTFKQVVFDGPQVMVVDSGNNVWYADTAIETAPNWTQVTVGSVKQVSLRNGMAAAMGTDNNTYFASSAKTCVWAKLTTPTTFAWVELMYPTGTNMITERPASAAPCRPGYSLYSGQCVAACPSGYTQSGTACTGVPVARTTRAATVVPPTTYTCPSGYDVNMTGATCNAIVGGTLASSAPVKEVFAISGYNYTQQQAQDKCVSYGATLATTAQVTAALTAGADWCSCSWTSDGGNSLYPITTSTQAGCGNGSGGIKGCGNGLAGANCYGVKPPRAQYTDVLPFATGAAWNQVIQCPVGYNVQMTATCNSTCPSGTWVGNGACVSPTIAKTTMPAVTTNYTCPTGYDPPGIVSCSGSTCGPDQTCYSTCPSGTIGSGTTCVPTPVARASSVGRQIITGYSCPTGTSQIGVSCYTPCNAGDTDNRTYCTHRNSIIWGVATSYYDTNYFKTSSSANPIYAAPSCPLGWTLTGSTCYQNCGSGTTATANNTCTSSTSITRTTTSATYTAPCQAGYKQSGTTCYKDCATGINDIGGNNCQAPNITRTNTTSTAVKSSLVPCNTNEDTVSGTSSQTCALQCATGMVSAPTTCTPATITVNAYEATYTCNSNETLQNGVCVSQCPAGTYPNGEICLPDEQVVATPSSIKCVATPYLSGNKWLCDSQEDADELLNDPSKTTTYVGAADQVCVADDPTTGMYFCQSGADAKSNNGTLAMMRKDYKSTCAGVKKNYMDLSNNLTSLLLIQSGMNNGSTQLTSAQTALTSIYTQLNCASPPNAQVTALCTQIQAGAAAIGTDSSNISSVLSSITTPIQSAISSRDSLLASIKNFQCSL